MANLGKEIKDRIAKLTKELRHSKMLHKMMVKAGMVTERRGRKPGRKPGKKRGRKPGRKPALIGAKKPGRKGKTAKSETAASS